MLTSPHVATPRRRRLALPRFSKLACVVVLGAAIAWPPRPAWAQVRLPSMGDESAEELSVASERRLGDQIMREVRRDPAYLDDPILLEYVQSLWQPLVDAARQRGDIDREEASRFQWEVFLVQDRSVNAFALPGGYVGIHLGLVALTASRDELAAVLAHELSHVTQRHIARSMASASRQSAIGMAAMVLGMIAASRSGNADMANAAIAGSQAAVIQGQLNFSRDMEREADRIGFGIFSAAGYGATGMAAMFEKLDRANRMNDSGGFPYLRSHPLTVDRLAEARARTALERTVGSDGRDVLHEMMQARARVLMDQGTVDLKRYIDDGVRAGSGVKGEGVLYAAALAAAFTRHTAGAQTSLRDLERAVSGITDVRASRSVSLLRAETMLRLGDTAPARALDVGASLASSRAALLLQAEAVLVDKQPAAAGTEADVHRLEQALVAWVAVHRSDAAAWAMLARYEERLGSSLRSLRAQAEVRAALGDVDAAIDRLRAAQRYSRRADGSDLVDALIVDARLRELEEMKREWTGPGRSGGGTERRP